MTELAPEERVHYRDQLREARYAALADAEGFGRICFALEALGLRLLGRQETLEAYKPCIASCAKQSVILSEFAPEASNTFKTFDALFRIVQAARNDAMHIGAYARHATAAAIELCIGLEDALMTDVRRIVGNVMVTSPITVAPWQPVAYVRQIMLMHSFSFLPARVDGRWCLVSELGLAKFLNVDGKTRRDRIGLNLRDAGSQGLETIAVSDEDLLDAEMPLEDVLKNSRVRQGPMLWLVVDRRHPDHLAGVLSPFELM